MFTAHQERMQMEIKTEIRNRHLLTLHNKLGWFALKGHPKHLLMAFINLVINIPVMNEIWRERRELEQMTNDQISDIGLDPIVIASESRRSFFDIPDERKKTLFVMTHAEFSQSLIPTTEATFKA